MTSQSIIMTTPASILIATSNLHKVQEIKTILKDFPFLFLNLSSFSSIQMPEEDGSTYAENALIKARSVLKQTGAKAVIADDSGLEVLVLDSAPGIFSARYAGVGASDEQNRSKLLKELKKVKKSKQPFLASFHCAIAYVDAKQKEKVYSAKVDGEIILQEQGLAGFGYDPLFYYPPFKMTMAQMREEQKNSISHRAQALRLFAEDYFSHYF